MGFFSADQIEILSKTTVRCAFLSEFRFESETVRVWNGNTELESNGNLYLPLRGAGQIEGLTFNGNATSAKITFSLPAIPTGKIDILKKAIDETDEVSGNLAIVSLQLFDEDWQCVGSPIGVAWGLMQKPKISRSQMQGTDGALQSITLDAENIFHGRSTPPAGRYTDRDQQTRHPGDLICQFVSVLAASGKIIRYPDY